MIYTHCLSAMILAMAYSPNAMGIYVILLYLMGDRLPIYSNYSRWVFMVFAVAAWCSDDKTPSGKLDIKKWPGITLAWTKVKVSTRSRSSPNFRENTGVIICDDMTYKYNHELCFDMLLKFWKKCPAWHTTASRDTSCEGAQSLLQSGSKWRWRPHPWRGWRRSSFCFFQCPWWDSKGTWRNHIVISKTWV